MIHFVSNHAQYLTTCSPGCSVWWVDSKAQCMGWAGILVKGSNESVRDPHVSFVVAYNERWRSVGWLQWFDRVAVSPREKAKKIKRSLKIRCHGEPGGPVAFTFR